MDKTFSSGLEFKSVVEAVNFFTGKDYKAWMKGTYKFNDDYFAWFPHFSPDGKPLKGDWINTISEDYAEIHERNKDFLMDIDWSKKHPQNRLVIGNIGVKGPYKFYGIYRIDNNKSNKHENVYVRVEESILLSDLI